MTTEAMEHFSSRRRFTMGSALSLSYAVNEDKSFLLSLYVYQF